MPYIKVLVADTWWKRVCGWMGKKDFELDDALLIPNCRCVHTFFMRQPIDVVFLDQNATIIAMVDSLPVWRVSPLVGVANQCLELPAGQAKQLGLCLGTKIDFIVVDTV